MKHISRLCLWSYATLTQKSQTRLEAGLLKWWKRRQIKKCTQRKEMAGKAYKVLQSYPDSSISLDLMFAFRYLELTCETGHIYFFRRAIRSLIWSTFMDTHLGQQTHHVIKEALRELNALDRLEKGKIY